MKTHILMMPTNCTWVILNMNIPFKTQRYTFIIHTLSHFQKVLWENVELWFLMFPQNQNILAYIRTILTIINLFSESQLYWPDLLPWEPGPWPAPGQCVSPARPDDGWPRLLPASAVQLHPLSAGPGQSQHAPPLPQLQQWQVSGYNNVYITLSFEFGIGVEKFVFYC